MHRHDGGRWIEDPGEDLDQHLGQRPADPRLMVRLLIYGYTTGVRSSRATSAAWPTT